MPQLAAQSTDYSSMIGFNPCFGQNDEAETSHVYVKPLWAALIEVHRSVFWPSTARFAEARQRLKTTVALVRDWDTYGSEAPNDVARALADKVLDTLEAESLPPTCLMPSSEGGIAISFVEGDNRAEIEIYNSGEIAVATYSAESEPVVWELTDTATAPLKTAINQIRVRLAA